MRLKESAPVRSVDEVGVGDFVQVEDGWKRIAESPTEGPTHAIRTGTVRTEGSRVYSLFHVLRFAKAEDLTE